MWVKGLFGEWGFEQNKVDLWSINKAKHVRVKFWLIRDIVSQRSCNGGGFSRERQPDEYGEQVNNLCKVQGLFELVRFHGIYQLDKIVGGSLP